MYAKQIISKHMHYVLLLALAAVFFIACDDAANTKSLGETTVQSAAAIAHSSAAVDPALATASAKADCACDTGCACGCADGTPCKCADNAKCGCADGAKCDCADGNCKCADGNCKCADGAKCTGCAKAGKCGQAKPGGCAGRHAHAHP